MKIGIVDLDTSHAEAWLPILRGLGHEVTGVTDGGDVHPAGHAERFARAHRVPVVFDSPEEMATAVDCAFLLGCDWDRHVERAGPFIAAGRAVFIDKPLAGRTADLRQLIAWRRAGARLCGGSVLPYAPAVTTWLAGASTERGMIRQGWGGCGVDGFGYGIHAYALLCALMGPGVVAARWLGGTEPARIELRWSDGRAGWVTAGVKGGAWLPFHATIATEREVFQCQPGMAGLYEAALGRIVPWLAGEAGAGSPDAVAFGEPELAALAALESAQTGGREVMLEAVAGPTRYDGAKFAAEYRARRYGGSG